MPCLSPRPLLFFGLALSSSALSAHHINGCNALHHHPIAAHMLTAEPEPIAQLESVVVKSKHKRNLNKRCAVSGNVPLAASQPFHRTLSAPVADPTGVRLSVLRISWASSCLEVPRAWRKHFQ
ncbi:uncharacterized protein LAESUDRAFT_772746 [Laetiporus sulphureus 93-53]|uniref:Secreted protein n=1 Tax=Laetiporus sulphureus 93-53 TaxID=1314785 RepID=A0A165ENP0_9APHY|nr:uncharacterized protein LAESUDRAFT_772746 [Laetiporus sulphureus 93-53]KZT07441.1 hypothetical protein LAESUDRAFT_772746 [Laetiporus sulphureus 93-53]